MRERCLTRSEPVVAQRGRQEYVSNRWKGGLNIEQGPQWDPQRVGRSAGSGHTGLRINFRSVQVQLSPLHKRPLRVVCAARHTRGERAVQGLCTAFGVKVPERPQATSGAKTATARLNARRGVRMPSDRAHDTSPDACGAAGAHTASRRHRAQCDGPASSWALGGRADAPSQTPPPPIQKGQAILRSGAGRFRCMQVYARTYMYMHACAPDWLHILQEANVFSRAKQARGWQRELCLVAPAGGTEFRPKRRLGTPTRKLNKNMITTLTTST